MSQSIQCLTCAHYLGLFKCAAFPKGIPDEIATGEHDHEQPYAGDGGKRWQPADDVAAELMNDLDDQNVV